MCDRGYISLGPRQCGGGKGAILFRIDAKNLIYIGFFAFTWQPGGQHAVRHVTMCGLEGVQRSVYVNVARRCFAKPKYAQRPKQHLGGAGKHGRSCMPLRWQRTFSRTDLSPLKQMV